MRAFASAWPERQIVQEGLAQITCYHNIALIEKLDPEETHWGSPVADQDREVSAQRTEGEPSYYRGTGKGVSWVRGNKKMKRRPVGFRAGG